MAYSVRFVCVQPAGNRALLLHGPEWLVGNTACPAADQARPQAQAQIHPRRLTIDRMVRTFGMTA